jgi:multidrug efflux system outer membrane protein
MRPARALAGALALALLAGQARAQTPAPAPAWREDFGDPVLAELLRLAEAQSLDVRAALARVAKARAELEAARHTGAPSLVVGGASAVGGRNFHDTTAAARPTLESEYEVDLWGKFARGRDSARQELAASADDLAATRLVVGAETVRTYVALRLAQDQLRAAAERARIADRVQALSAVRAARGAATQAAAGGEAEAASEAHEAFDHAQAEAALALDRLRLVVGDRDLVVPAGPAPVPPAAAQALAWDVDQRPDVQAALARFRAADARRAEAVAASRPQFELEAALGTPDAAIATLLDVRALAWAAAASITHDLIGSKIRRAEARAAAADADLADIAYRKTVLTAWSEQASALAGVADAARDLRRARAQAGIARGALETAERRHSAGVLDGVDLGASELEAADRAEALAEAQATATDARVALLLARGGVP